MERISTPGLRRQAASRAAICFGSLNSGMPRVSLPPILKIAAAEQASRF